MEQHQEEGYPLQAKKALEAVSSGSYGYEIETTGTQGLRVVRAEEGFLQCSFVVPKILADKNGYWHIGAVAVLIDNVGCAAIGSATGVVKASVNFDISYYSPVKIEEEVVVEGKVLQHKGKLSSVMVEIRRKNNEELVALGKQWMIPFGNNQKPPKSKL